MSTNKISISIYSNLPTGGASQLEKLNRDYLIKRANLTYISDARIKPRSFLNYLYICIYKLPQIHKMFAQKIINKSTLLIAYHSWLTKSPHILRYYFLPKIYICQEIMREYFDPQHISTQNIKEKIINIIKLPIKYIDKQNLRSRHLTIIANSFFSKNMIDNYYGVSSKVIYPGIDTFAFKQNVSVKKKNQIISVGAINKLKGYEFILQVVSKINKSLRPKLVIVGNGADVKYLINLKELARKLNVSIDCKTNISKALLINEYLKSKLFIYAPINEPFGIVVEEAMAARLPLVVYKKGGGYIEILSENNGLIINNLNIEKWAKQVENLLGNQKLLEKYGKYNMSYVNKNYTAEIMNNNLWKIIQSI